MSSLSDITAVLTSPIALQLAAVAVVGAVVAAVEDAAVVVVAPPQHRPVAAVAVAVVAPPQQRPAAVAAVAGGWNLRNLELKRFGYLLFLSLFSTVVPCSILGIDVPERLPWKVLSCFDNFYVPTRGSKSKETLVVLWASGFCSMVVEASTRLKL